MKYAQSHNMHNHIICTFGDTLCTIQVPNVAFYAENKFEMM